MPESNVLINRVKQSGLITIDLADLYPTSDEVVEIDVKDYLFKELVLMEKPFREDLKQVDWHTYQNKVVAIHCSTDALIPHWAYMLIASYLKNVAKQLVFGSVETVKCQMLLQNINTLDTQQYTNSRVVIKGCGDESIPAAAYLAITSKLTPVVKSLMYGEPCSTVPIYKLKDQMKTPSK